MASPVKQVFISYATEEDTDFAHRLADDLKGLGARVWIAPESILPGESWVDAIERGLGESSHVAMVLTPAALEASGVKMERDMAITLALQDRIKVISLRVKPCEVPLVLSRYQMLLAFQEDYDAGLGQLARALGLTIAEPGQQQPVAEPQVATSERRQPFEPEMILIPAGEFLMGSDAKKDKDAEDYEQPQHCLSLPDYYIAKTPVTNAQYLAFMEATGHRQPGHWEKGKPPKNKEDHPVVNVDWQDTMAYCQWLAEAIGRAYRLPSEAEWEKAARGADGRVYPWGDDPPDETRCNFNDNVEDTTPVGQYSPRGDSAYGCVDMAGNVSTWTLSLWGTDESEPEFKYPYDPEDGRENLEADDDVYRVLRGVGFNEDQWYMRCACRDRMWPGEGFDSVGFRVILAPGL